MKTLRLRLAVLLAPLMTLAIVLAGCGGDTGKKGGEKGSTSSSDGGNKDKTGSTAKKAIEGKGHGTLKGQVVYDGVPPDTADADKAILAKMEAKDKTHCVTGATPAEKASYEWIVHPQTKGVKNVMVWLAPGDNAYFKLSDGDKKPARDKVLIHQPHCAFIPHVDVAFTHFYDGTKFVPTGQKIAFKNDADTAHNTNYRFTKSSGGTNLLLNPGDELIAEVKRPDEITLSCEIHPWMRAYIRAFDHPFAAVTDENGNYEIKNVPTGVQVQLVVWHEPDVYSEGGTKGKTVTLKDGENTENIKIKAE